MFVKLLVKCVLMFLVTSSGLSQDQLILLAFFTGSDYTEGVQGVGVVSAVEILRDFPGKGMEVLQKFRYVCYREYPLSYREYPLSYREYPLSYREYPLSYREHPLRSLGIRLAIAGGCIRKDVPSLVSGCLGL